MDKDCYGVSECTLYRKAQLAAFAKPKFTGERQLQAEGCLAKFERECQRIPKADIDNIH